jgi:hypothetical protein
MIFNGNPGGKEMSLGLLDNNGSCRVDLAFTKHRTKFSIFLPHPKAPN